MAEPTNPDAETPTRLLDDEGLFARLKDWFTDDYEHHCEWLNGVEENDDTRIEGGAKEDYEFVSGHQWDAETLTVMRDQNRPTPVFNLVESRIDAVTGFEVSNRQETRYLQRKLGGTGVNEVLSAAVKWFRDQTDAEDEESDAFRDAVICGKGWTETRIDYETNPDGDPRIERIDPFEIFPNRYSQKPNFADANRVWRIRKMSFDEATAMFPDADPEMLSAGWALSDQSEPYHQNPLDDYTFEHSTNGNVPDCTIIECQWWEREPYVRYVDGNSGEVIEVTLDEFSTLMDRLQAIPPEQLMMMGVMPPKQMVTQYRRVYRRAFVGASLLDVKPVPVEGNFTYKAITGKRDQTRGHFYGLVRVMKDPQRWTNKLFSQIMHILNTNAKGGLIAERGAFEDDRQAMEDWAKADSIVWTEDGALSNPSGPKVMPKPGTPYPQGQEQMLNFAMGVMPLVTGVSLEFMGTREVDQPGVLEHQRTQRTLNVLATLFDSLRRYRKEQGRLMLGLIQKYLSDGRLVKIVDKDQVQFLPLDRSLTLGEYEVIVDEAPTSPNAKERNWGIITSMLPLIQPVMTPQIAAGLFRYSPLPENVASQITESLLQEPPPPPPEAKAMEQLMQQLQTAGFLANIDKDAASAEKQRSDALFKQAETFAKFGQFMQMVNPNLPMAPVPSGPVPGMNMPQGAMTPQVPGMGAPMHPQAPQMPAQQFPPMPPQQPPMPAGF